MLVPARRYYRMAKRKPKPKKSTVEEVIDLFLDGAALTHDAEDIRAKTAETLAIIDEWEADAVRADAKGRRRLARSAHLAGSLGPTEFAELLSKAPGSLRTILIKSLDKILPAAP